MIEGEKQERGETVKRSGLVESRKSKRRNRIARKSKNIEKGKKVGFVIFWGIISEKGKRGLYMTICDIYGDIYRMIYGDL